MSAIKSPLHGGEDLDVGGGRQNKKLQWGTWGFPWRMDFPSDLAGFLHLRFAIYDFRGCRGKKVGIWVRFAPGNLGQGVNVLISLGFGVLPLGSFRNFHLQDWRTGPPTSEHKTTGTETGNADHWPQRAQRAQRTDSRKNSWNRERR